MKSAPQHRFTHPATLCRRENSQLPSFQAIPIYPPWRDSCLPRLPRPSRGSSRSLPSLPRASKRAQFAKCCKNTKTATLTTFRINTCKSVSKQRTLTLLRINTYKKTGEGGYESVWQLCCLGEFLVISMIHLHSSEVVARGGLDFLCAGYFQWGLSRHMRVRFNAVVARANSAATFLSPRIRNLRIPRCSFKIPMTGSASAFRRRYNARPVVEANLLRMRRRAG